LAAARSEDARGRAGLLEDPTALGIALAACALAHAHDGRSDLARAEAADALHLFERVQWRSGAIFPLWALGLAELGDENPGRVDAVLGPLAGQVAQMGAGDPVLTMFLPDEIEALIELGELERARQYLEPFERSARDLDRAWALAMAERCRGALHAAHREPELALAAFERALGAHQRAGMPFERARTLLLAGQVYRRQKQWGQARQMLGEALSEFERVGAKLWAGRARAEIERIGLAASPGGELTATERRVAELAATGLSNQEIAQRAFLSVKTVEANLTRVYRKLGVHSRSGLPGALAASERHR
jgi:DNA-binding CsgD family transcriptional regulator